MSLDQAGLHDPVPSHSTTLSAFLHIVCDTSQCQLRKLYTCGEDQGQIERWYRYCQSNLEIAIASAESAAKYMSVQAQITMMIVKRQERVV